jgi:arylsulfatase A-like enzyme
VLAPQRTAPVPAPAPRARSAGAPPAAARRPDARASAIALALGLAVAFAALTGLAEAALLTFTRLYLHRLTHVTSRVVWMAPVTYAALFLVLALPFALAALRRPRGWWLPALVALLAFLSTYSVLQLATGLYPWARELLAAGVAVRLAILAPRWRPRFGRLVPRAAIALATAVVLVGVGSTLAARIRERRMLASLPAARADAPNVLLLIWDTVRASSLSLYGYGRPTTPVLQRFASSGVTFDQAISTAPWTLPSHAGMFTGRWAHELSAGWRMPLDGRYPTLAEVLADNGYATTGFIANTHYTSAETGLARGMAHYEGFGSSPGDFLMSTALGRTLAWDRWLRTRLGSFDIPGRKNAARIDGDFLHWLDGRPAGHPFFAFLNYYDAHEPYLPPAPYDTLFRSTTVPRKPLMWQAWKMTPPQVRGEMDAYDGSIAYLDTRLGSLLQALRGRGLLDNTIVILVADHGEEFGEHVVFTHGNSLYLPSLHVPLVIVGPGAAAGARVAPPVTLRDLPATVLDLAGIRRSPFPGESLARFWARGATPADQPLVAEVGQASGLPAFYPVAVGDMRSVFAGGYHLIQDGDGRQELYDIRRDPGEVHNLLPARGVRP